MGDAVLTLQNITHTYGDMRVLDKLSLTLNAGQAVALTGPSGSGKSTLLQIAGLLDAPSQGEVSVCGTPADTDRARTQLRRHEIGFVYQFHHLLPEFSALENIMMPLRIAGLASKGHAKHALDLLGEVGLSERAQHRPAELSGGERQRVAICRALIHEPSLILADEPTGNLDEANADTIFAMFLKLARESGAAILVATHNMALAAQLDMHYQLHLGRLEAVK
jgi:lipoprotein-releasing system ATP-binding protein